MNFLFNIVVWGEIYTTFYLDISLKAQMAPGNIPQFVDENNGNCKYIIYTTSAEVEKIRRSEVFQHLSNLIATDFVLIETLDTYDRDIRKTPVLCNAHAMKLAAENDYYIIFLVPDMIFSDGSFTNLLKIARTGKRVVMMGYFRTLWESFVPVFKQLYSSEQSQISATSRELIKLALHHLHPETKSWTWASPNFRRRDPVFMYTTVPGNGMIERSFHLHPIMICPKKGSLLPKIESDWSIDGSSYLSQAFPDFEEYYVVQDSDEVFALDLLHFDERYRGYIKPGEFNYLELLLWPTRHAHASHFFNYRHKIYFHINDIDSSWQEADSISNRVATSLESMLEFSNKFPEIYKEISDLYNERNTAIEGKNTIIQVANTELTKLKNQIVDGLNELGNMQVEVGKIDKAIGSFTQVTELHPERLDAHLNLARLFAQKKDHFQASNHIHKALAISPDCIDANKLNNEIVCVHRRTDVLLLPPTFRNVYNTSADMHLPFGIACMAGYFKNHPNINLLIPYAPRFNGTAEELLTENTFSVVSSGGMVIYLDYFIDFFKMSEQLRPQAKRILGGPVVGALPKEMLFGLMPIDAAVVGEGEETFEELILALSNGTPLTEVKGIIYRAESGEIIATPQRPYMNLAIKDPTPDWFSFFDLENYKYDGRRQVPISAGRGCPNQCHFCGSPLGRYRYREPHNVVNELKSLKKSYNLERFYFNDETFGSNKKITSELCDTLAAEDMTIPWSCFLRANLVDSTLLSKMKSAGCDQVVIGIESGSPATLKRMKKNITIEQCKNAVLKVREAGLRPLIAIMFGYIDETQSDLRMTIDLMIELNELPEFITHTTVVPGTELYDECIRNGKICDHLQHIKTMNRGMYFDEPPLLNLTKIPDANYYSFLLDEKRRLHSTLYNLNLARVTSHINQADMDTYIVNCPSCSSQHTVQTRAVIWHQQLCTCCNRYFWIETLSEQRLSLKSFLANCRTNSKRLIVFSFFDGQHLEDLFKLEPIFGIWDLVDTVISNRTQFYDRKVVAPDKYSFNENHSILVLDSTNIYQIKQYFLFNHINLNQVFFVLEKKPDLLSVDSPTPLLSIIIPSLRTESLMLCIDNIYRYNADIDFEIVVVSPFTPPVSPRLRHIFEEIPIGNARATDLGFANARGNYILTIADDMLLRPGCLKNLINYMQAHDGQLFVASLRGYDSEHIWIHWGFYGKLLAYCPCIARDNVALIGGVFFDPILKNFFGDHDLSLRVWHAYGIVDICPDAWFESISTDDKVKKDNTASSLRSDKEIFFSRWEPHYGSTLNYSRAVDDHVAFSKTVITRLTDKTPPDAYWEIKGFIESEDWSGLRSALYDDKISPAISKGGLSMLRRLLKHHNSIISKDIFRYIHKFSEINIGYQGSFTASKHVPMAISFKILFITLEFTRWQQARSWSYPANIGFEDGFAANGITFLTVPALREFAPNDPFSWLSHLKEICSGKQFEQVWIEVVHNNLDDAILSYIATLAPVRLAIIGESLTYPDEVYIHAPYLKNRQAEVVHRLKYMTHALVGDELDVEWLNSHGIVKALWWVQAIPEHAICTSVLPVTSRGALFSGALYGEREQWLQNPLLKGLLAHQQPLEEEAQLPDLFDQTNYKVISALQSKNSFSEELLAQHLSLLRKIRRQSFALWLQGLTCGTAVVNLPSFYQGYAGRVYEGMAAGRPVISWDIPDRPRTRALFEDDKEILLFSKDNPEQLELQIRKVQDDPSFADGIVNNARIKLQSYHTIELRVRQILTWIENGVEPDYGEVYLQIDPDYNIPYSTGQNIDISSSLIDKHAQNNLSSTIDTPDTRMDDTDYNDQYYRHLFMHDPDWSSLNPNTDELQRWDKIRNCLDSIVPEIVSDKKTVPNLLEIGSGRGWLSNLLSEYGSVIGIEPVKPVVEHASKLFPAISFVNGTTDSLIGHSIRREYFDIIVSSEVIEHVPYEKQNTFVEQINQLLVPGGYAVITTPRKEVFEYLKMRGACSNQPIEDWLTENELSNLFMRHCLNPVSLSTIIIDTETLRLVEPEGKQPANVMALYQIWLFSKPIQEKACHG